MKITLKLSTLIAYDWVRSVDMSEKQWHELYQHLSIITFLFIQSYDFECMEFVLLQLQ